MAARPTSEPGENWIADQVDQHVDALYRHVALVYPLLDSSRGTRAAFERLAGASREEVLRLGTYLWLLRSVRERAWEADTDIDLARRRNADAVRFALWDVARAAGPDADADRAVNAVANLSVAEQEILRITSVEDLATDQLATVLGLEWTLAKNALLGAQRRLRHLYEQSGHDVGTRDETSDRTDG